MKWRTAVTGGGWGFILGMAGTHVFNHPVKFCLLSLALIIVTNIGYKERT